MESQKENIAKRIARGMAANSFAQIVTLLVTIVSVPFFYRSWGIDLYGEWLMVSAIPTYLTMSDLSFGTTAGSEMTMLSAQGKHLQALKVLQTAWLLVTGASLAILVIMLVAVRFVPLATWLHLSILSNHEAMSIMTILLVSVCLSQQGGLIDAAFKCSGSYAKGIFLLNLLRLIEFIAGTAVLIFRGDPWIFAWTLVIPKAIGYVWCWAILRKQVPWLHLGWSYADKAILKPLVSPALTFNAFNLGFAFSIQGMALLVGIRSSPADTAIFSNLRTLTRVVLQGANMVGNTVWPEFSSVMGRGDLELARRLHRRASQVSFWFVLPAIATMAFIGPTLFRFLTGRIVTDPWLFFTLLLVTLLGSIWSVSYVVPLSINKHQSTAFTFIFATVGALLLAKVLIEPMGAMGAGVALLVGEAVMVVFVLTRSLTLLHDHLPPFLVQLLTPPVDLVKKIWGRLRRSDSAKVADNEVS